MLKFKNHIKEAYTKVSEKTIQTLITQWTNTETALGRWRERGISIPLDAPPPINSEIEIVQNIADRSSKQERDFGVGIDRSKLHYQMWASEATRITGKLYDSDFFSRISTNIDGLVLHYKYAYARERPYQHGVRSLVGDIGTPSYPSGHAADAWVFAYVLSKKHPHLSTKFEAIAKKVSDSRIILGVHFPSDCEAGKLVAKFIMDNQLIDY